MSKEECRICGYVHKCIQCDICSLKGCQKCIELHKDACSTLKKEMKHLCTVHGDFVNGYCFTCFHLVCKNCAKEGHINHTFFPIPQAVHNIRSEILTSVNDLEKRKAQEESATTQLCQRKNDYEQKLSAFIDAEEKELYKVITDTKDSLVKQIIALNEKNLSDAKEIVPQLDAAIDNLKSVQDKTFPILFLSRWSNPMLVIDKHKRILKCRESADDINMNNNEDIKRIFRSSFVTEKIVNITMGDEAAPPIIIPTNYGRIDEFDDISEDWIQYTERLNHYFIANNIEITDHQNPKPSSIVQRCKFNSRSRQPNESVSQFVAELRQISEHCVYKATLDDMLRDRLVCGIKEDRIQRRLLAEPGLTFKKAMEVATAMEMAAKNAHDLQVQEPKQVHKVTIRNEECYRCGGSHNATDCKWKDAKCYVRDKKGHLAKKCRNKGKQNDKEKPKFKQQTQQGKVYPKQRPTKTHFVEEDSDDMEDTYTMYQLEGKKRKPYLVSVKLNNTEINMEIDTGASVSVISQETCKQVFGSDNSLEKSPCSLRTYKGEKIDVLGKRNVTVIYNSQSVDLPITVVKGTGPSLMGRDWLHKLQLNWKSIFKIEQLSHNQEPEKDKELQDLLRKYPQVFKEGLGTLKGTKARIYVDKDATPKYFKARPVPYALKEKIEKELDRLEKRRKYRKG
ncbi:unnamed protein product [Mytilus coruscus]|uniref:B box-type domain-containing protein n=1 Tax=Mytilus coruscus TaxID=42192 RepID=A0A6J8E731_MYTCO|nr:unnamed protein product [Mytilus coruscus]